MCDAALDRLGTVRGIIKFTPSHDMAGISSCRWKFPYLKPNRYDFLESFFLSGFFEPRRESKESRVW